MSDRMRDQVRSAIAEMLEEAPAPAPFTAADRFVVTRWRGPIIALAAFAVVALVIGLTSLRQPPGGEEPVVLDAPQLSELGPLMIPTETLGLSLEDAYWSGTESSYLVYRLGGDDSRVVSVLVDTFPMDERRLETAEERLRATFPDSEVTRTTIAGADAYVAVHPDGVVDVAAFEIGDDPRDSVSLAVAARGVSRGDVLSMVQSLESVEEPAFARAVADQIGWDVRVDAWRQSQVEALAAIDGLASVERRSTDLPFGRLLSTVQSDDTVVVTTTTTRVEEDSGVTSAPPSIVQDDIDDAAYFLTMEEGADLDDLLAQLPDQTVVRLSPGRALQEADEFFDYLEREGTRLDDRPVYQAPFGPEPQFDTGVLGQEMPLSPVLDADRITLTHSYDGGLGGRSADGPVVSIGQLEGGQSLALVFNGLTTYLESDGTGGGGGDLRYHRLGLSGGSSGEGLDTITYRVPLDTSVAQVVVDGASYWQRPAGGYGFMAFEGLFGDFPPAAEIVGYDADGGEIGRWLTEGG